MSTLGQLRPRSLIVNYGSFRGVLSSEFRAEGYQSRAVRGNAMPPARSVLLRLRRLKSLLRLVYHFDYGFFHFLGNAGQSGVIR